MKKIFLMVAMAAFIFSSCSISESENDPINNGSSKNDAYMAVNISVPTTKAGPTEENGTPEESSVSSVYILQFDGGEEKLGVANLTTEEYGIAGKPATKAFKVHVDTKKIFVVINPSSNLLNRIEQATTFTAVNKAIVEDASALSQNNKFTMTSDGVDSKGTAYEGLTEVTPSKDNDPAIAAQKAIANAVTVKVDRVVAKVIVSKDKLKVEGGQADVNQIMFALNATNKSYFPYAKLEPKYLATDAKYRIDPNYNILTDEESRKELNWKANPDDGNGWLNKYDNPIYCLENTMQAEDQMMNFRNTTHILVKAQFVPYIKSSKNEDSLVVSPIGTSWFRYKIVDPVIGKYTKTAGFATMDADYLKQDVDGKAKFSAFLDAVLGADRTKGFTGENKINGVVTLADLDRVPDGSFKASQVVDGVEYFKNSINYYEARIMHDYRQPQFTGIGRWGVVRNNCYKISLDRLGKPGKSILPPPNNTPDDQEDAFLSVTIVVNPWTVWTQGIDLDARY